MLAHLMKYKGSKNSAAARIFVCAMLICAPALALDPNQPLSQLHRTFWTSKDGLIGSVTALAQTADGFLWVGTSDGLFRFDGVFFEKYRPETGELPASGVSSLLAVANSGLWIGYTFGGVSHLKNGRLTTYSVQETGSITRQLPRGRVESIAKTPDGRVWVASVSGMALFEREQWHLFGEWRNRTHVRNLFVDRLGNLWVAAGSGLKFLPIGGTSLQETGIRGYEVFRIVEAPDGTIWGHDFNHESLRSVSPLRANESAPSMSINIGASAIFFDREGRLWLSGDGLTRIPFHKLLKRSISQKEVGLDRLTSTGGFTGGFARQMLEDQEGNIWIGSDGGLVRFRSRNLSWFPLEPGTSNFSLIAGRGGDTWAFPQSAIKKLSHAIRVQDRRTIDGAPNDVQLAYGNLAGSVWLAAINSFWSWKNGRFSEIPSPVPGSPFQVTALTEDGEGVLWVSHMNQGIFAHRNGKWVSAPILKDHPRFRAESIGTDASGRVWFAYDDRVAVLDHGEIQTFSSENGLSVGRIQNVSSGSAQVWVGGRSGVAFLQAGRFHSLTLADGTELGPIAEILATKKDGLWLSARPGIVHVPESEIQLLLRNPVYCARADIFDLVSDLPDSLQTGTGSPSIIQGSDGFLWFATRVGVARIDPAHIIKNHLPPPVSIRSMTADQHSFSTLAPISLPPFTKDLRIDYTALSLSIPEKVRFRYKLQGSDANWQDVGTRRQAFYANLKPGSYTFRVVACNNDGIWNEEGASLSLNIQPAFFQTDWFRALCLACALGFLYLLYALRVQQITARVQDRVGVRLMERERIARELHDTLLQGFSGLVLRFQAVMKQMPAQEPARRTMEQALDRADEVLLEGRLRVRDLRSVSMNANELAETLAACGEELSVGNSLRFSLAVVGKSQLLDPLVFDEAYRICREALINAFQHSTASKIETELTYNSAGLRLVVRDNGCGIDPLLLSGGRSGHWGLSGIRERARNMGCRVSIRSNQGAGTEIDLHIPEKIAYPSRSRHSRWMSIWKKWRPEV